jgi:colicin import membrane protein
LQTKSNSELRSSAKGRRNGVLGTILIHLLLLGMLILVGFSTPPPPESEEGILVNFGTGETGIGDIEPSPPAFKEESTAPVVKEVTTPPAAPLKASAKTKEEALLTQNTEEAPAVKKADPEAVKKKLEKIEADKKIKEQKEAELILRRQEEAEKKRIAAEQQRESDIMNRTKNALADSKNRGTSSTGEGIAGGSGNQGDPNGSINSKVRGHGSGSGDSGTGSGDKGISYNLQGRGFQALPPPKYDYQGEGRVVVEVSVDRSGKVIQATPGTKGSTTLDEYLLKVAKEAALEARFEMKQDAPAVQKGTITYNFILK